MYICGSESADQKNLLCMCVLIKQMYLTGITSLNPFINTVMTPRNSNKIVESTAVLECFELPICSLSISGCEGIARVSLPPPQKFRRKDSLSRIVDLDKRQERQHIVCDLKRQMRAYVGNEIRSSELGRWSCPTETKYETAGQVAALLIRLSDTK